MGNVTLSSFSRTIFGNKRIVICRATMSSQYATNGDTLAASAFGLRTVEMLVAEPKSGYVFEYDYANGKLKAFQGNYTATAAGALSEVAASGDLSAVSGIGCFAIGYGLK